MPPRVHLSIFECDLYNTDEHVYKGELNKADIGGQAGQSWRRPSLPQGESEFPAIVELPGLIILNVQPISLAFDYGRTMLKLVQT